MYCKTSFHSLFVTEIFESNKFFLILITVYQSALFINSINKTQSHFFNYLRPDASVDINRGKSGSRVILGEISSAVEDWTMSVSKFVPESQASGKTAVGW